MKRILSRLAAALLAAALCLSMLPAALAAGSLAVRAYESSSDRIEKDDRVDLTLHFLMTGVTTADARNKGLDVSRLVDSFSGGGQTVTITSADDQPLEFDAAFSNLTYSGAGKSFRVMAGIGGEYETAEITVTQAVEYDASKQDPPVPQPQFELSRSDLPRAVQAGQVFTVEIGFRNLSNSDVDSFVASVTPSEGLILLDGVSSYPVGSIRGGRSGSVTVRLRAADTIASASQSLSVDMKFSYESAGNWTQGSASEKINIPAQVAAKESNPQPMVVISRSPLSAPLKANQQLPVTITFQNMGKTALRNPVASFNSSDSLTILNDVSTFLLRDIGPGESRSVTLRVKTGKTISSTSLSIDSELKYTYDTGETLANASTSDKVNLSATPTDSANSGTRIDSPTPNLIVSSYGYGGDQIAAGGKFNLELTFRNTSANLTVENIVLTLETGDSFAVDKAANTYYYKNLAPGGEQSLTVPMQALPAAKPGAQSVSAAFKYEYVDGTRRASGTASVALSIPIYQPDRFEIAPPVLPESFNVNQEAALSLNYVNKGKSEISNVSASIVSKEGEITTLTSVQNLGNFESGKSGSIGFALTPLVTGQLDLTLVVSYEDASGKAQSKQFPVKMKVQEAPPTEAEVPAEEQPAETGMPVWPWIAGGAAAAAALAVLLIIRKKKKAAAEPVLSGWESWDDAAEPASPDKKE